MITTLKDFIKPEEKMEPGKDPREFPKIVNTYHVNKNNRLVEVGNSVLAQNMIIKEVYKNRGHEVLMKLEDFGCDVNWYFHAHNNPLPFEPRVGMKGMVYTIRNTSNSIKSDMRMVGIDIEGMRVFQKDSVAQKTVFMENITSDWIEDLPAAQQLYIELCDIQDGYSIPCKFYNVHLMFLAKSMFGILKDKKIGENLTEQQIQHAISEGGFSNPGFYDKQEIFKASTYAAAVRADVLWHGEEKYNDRSWWLSNPDDLARSMSFLTSEVLGFYGAGLKTPNVPYLAERINEREAKEKEIEKNRAEWEKENRLKKGVTEIEQAKKR